MDYHLIKYSEHCSAKEQKTLGKPYIDGLTNDFYSKSFTKRNGKALDCFLLTKKDDDKYDLTTGYFIGVDWILKNKKAIYVAPKLNSKDNNEIEIDFTKMLFDSLRYPDVLKYIDDLCTVKWDEPTIEIEQTQDLLTPLLVVEFLSVLKTIVRKGLKKSYYKVEENLNSRVKGKVMIAKSIKHNLMRNKNLYTFCNYEVFGLDNKENRLLKKALVFVKHYLPHFFESTKSFNEKGENYLQNTFNYISPAFDEVYADIELNEIKHTKMNSFYKEYGEATRLAKLILKRFGYNISNTSQQKVKTPPFWIDMSILFEVYVLGMLKDRFHNDVEYHTSTYGNELDFLLKAKGHKMVIDAKYKPYWDTNNIHDDVRQVSGYARLEKVYKDLGYDIKDEMLPVLDCLIIYPRMNDGCDDIIHENLKGNPLKGYVHIYKLGVKLPIINKH